MKALARSLFAVLVVCGGLASIAADGSQKCPISGKPADGSLFLEVNGAKVAFCCKGCVDPYKKQINLVAVEGEQKCPLSGKPASPDHSIVQKTAEKIAFCCGDCAENFSKKNNFVAKESRPGKCPISGKDAVAEAATTLTVNGNSVFFCCAGCVKPYLTKLGVQDHSEKCPISGKPTDAATAQIFVKSEEIGFCCGNCKGDYVKKNFADGKFTGGEKPAAPAEKKEAADEKKAEPKRSRI